MRHEPRAPLPPAFQVDRVYLRVSTDAQDLRRQDAIMIKAKSAGYYVAAVYREKASGARADRPELLRMIADLQSGEVVIAEKIDRISRLPLAEAEHLVAKIRREGAWIAVPGVVDLSDLATGAEGISRIVLESIQEMLLKIALQMADDDYIDRRERQRQGIALAKAEGRIGGRSSDRGKHARIIALPGAGKSIAGTADLVECDRSTVKRVWSGHLRSKASLTASAT